MSDWKSIENEREKYAAYLCSREWSELKEAVHKRSKGICERCWVLPGNAVHHLTYERKYDERLEDLQHNCNACHDFTHAKSDFDPCLARDWCQYVAACNDLPPVGIYTASCWHHIPAVAVLDALFNSVDGWKNSPDELKVKSSELLNHELINAMAYYQHENKTITEELVFWIVTGKPSVRHDLWDESLKQIRKCTGSKPWHSQAGGH